MGRFHSFLLGVIVGGAAVFGAMKYHIVRADDGLYFVPKITAGFREIYVDIRNYGLEDWNQHRNVALALIQANKSHLLKDSAVNYFRDSVDGALRGTSVPAYNP
jgi:hypothetical protein